MRRKRILLAAILAAGIALVIFSGRIGGSLERWLLSLHGQH